MIKSVVDHPTVRISEDEKCLMCLLCIQKMEGKKDVSGSNEKIMGAAARRSRRLARTENVLTSMNLRAFSSLFVLCLSGCHFRT